MRFDLEYLTRRLGGTFRPTGVPAGSVDGVSIDSRRIDAGMLFAAIRADRDGHDFAGLAAEAGAAALLVDHALDVAVPQIVVDDTASALARIGAEARGRMDGPVVGVTGSVGKTTTKDLLAAILARSGPIGASERSLNNELGVPLTLANAPDAAWAAVIEMGARGVGHIAELGRIARPTVGVVLCVAEAHLEMFGDLDGVARAKGELVEALPVSGTAVLNRGDDRVAAMASRSPAPVLWFGAGGDVVAEHVELDADLHPRFVLRTPAGSARVRLGVRGRHNVDNALAAAAAAHACGVGAEQTADGLASATLSPWRMSLQQAKGGGAVLDDSYNANPASMRAALDALAELPAERRVAVLGVMAELGPEAEREHRAIATMAEDRGIEVVAVGTELYGLPAYLDVDEALSSLPAPGPGEVVLVKGSRVAGLERLAQAWSGPASSRA